MEVRTISTLYSNISPIIDRIIGRIVPTIKSFARTNKNVLHIAGECVAYPLTCSNEFAPVCGCDGRYYGNSCYAATDGSSVRKQGQC